MANELKSETEADALLKMVNEQIALSAFDSNDTGLLKQMVENLGDKRGMVRLGFAEALGKVGKPAVPFLVEAVRNHRDPVVRRSSAKALALIRDATTIPSLIQAILTDEDTVVRSSSVGALAKMGEASVPVLLETLASPESPETTKGLMTWALAFIGAEAKEQLYKAFDSDLPEVRSAIVGAIAKVAEEEQEERAFELLTNSLKDSASSVRSEAACALGNLDYQPAVPCLLELLGHELGETRKAAALALMKIGDSTALASLETALGQESDATVEQVIKLAISRLSKVEEEDDWN